MRVIVEGRKILVRDVIPLKALFPILETVVGTMILTAFRQ